MYWQMCGWMDESKAQGEDAMLHIDILFKSGVNLEFGKVKPREEGYWDVSRRRQVPQEDNQRDIGRMLARK